MTITTAAEALEKLIRLERDLEKKCHDLGYYNMIHVGLREFVEHAATLRAALAAPQPDEAVALLREAYNELIVDPEQDEATRAVGDALVERIRAFLKDRT